MNARANLTAVLVVMVFAVARTGSAATIVPPSIAQLTRGSEACVIASVLDVRGVRTPGGRIETLVELAINEVIQGQVDGPLITLHEPGGVVDGWRESFDASPQYAAGEHVVVFVGRRRDGNYRTNHLFLGKFEITGSGEARVRQNVPHGTVVLLPPGVDAPGSSLPLETLRAIVQGSIPDSAAPPRVFKRGDAEPEIDLLGSRFFEADQGVPLSFLIDARGDSILGFDAARSLVRQAMRTWTDVGSATITLHDGGLTNDLSAPCPGPHVILFNDPQDQIPPPQACSGVLGVGGNCSSDVETKVISGRDYTRAQRGLLTLADDWEGCAQWTPCNIAEIAVHELGHALGLGHSSEREDESDPLLREATMYYRAAFDGRCAGVRAYDVAAMSLVYPTAIPASIISQSPLPPAVALRPYEVTLHATGGRGTLSWQVIEGGFPGLELAANGVLSGSPQAFGNGFFRIRLQDSQGDSHTKLFDIVVRQAGTCPGNCDGNAAVGMADLLTLVAIALEQRTTDQCPDAAGADSLVTIEDIVQAVSTIHESCS